MDVRYPMPVSLGAPMPRFVAPSGVIASNAGTWVPIEYVELLTERVAALEAELVQAKHVPDRVLAAVREGAEERSAARIAALEKENAALCAILDEIAIPTIVEAQSRFPNESFYGAQLRAIESRRHGVTTPEEPR